MPTGISHGHLQRIQFQVYSGSKMSQIKIIVWIIPLLIANYVQTNPRSLEVLPSELVRVGEDLLQQTDTRPDFWFLKESVVAPSVEDVHEQLLLTEPFASHPKLMINEKGSFRGSNPGIPKAALVFLGSVQRYFEHTI